TALCAFSFFSFVLGRASRPETTMMSPMLAYFRFEPPSTLMQNTFLAPELSATSSTLVIWIMVDLLPYSLAPPPSPSTTRQRLSLLVGLVSAMRTRSPSWRVGFFG